MPRNPLFSASVSPTNTTQPTKAVNQTQTRVRLTHNTFDNSYFNFKTQRYAQYEPFFWKSCVAGDNEPLSVSHNVRSLPFASPILSPMTLNKDYFLVPNFAIQPNSWDYIFKNPTQGDDVPDDAHNVFEFISTQDQNLFSTILNYLSSSDSFENIVSFPAQGGFRYLQALLIAELFFSSGSLLFNLGYKINPIFDVDGVRMSFDEFFDFILRSSVHIDASFLFPDPDSPSAERLVKYSTDLATDSVVVDKYTLLDILRSHAGYLQSGTFVLPDDFYPSVTFSNFPVRAGEPLPLSPVGVNCINMDTIIAYQMCCAQYYVNPRVDFLYNAQLYRDNFINLLRFLHNHAYNNQSLEIQFFYYNGIPVMYDYFSHYYYADLVRIANGILNGTLIGDNFSFSSLYSIFSYLFGYQNTLKFGNYFTDSRTQALGYGEEGSDNIQVVDSAVSVTDLSQKLVLERFRGAVAHLDNTFEDYLQAMFHEALPPDFHFPKFIAHSEFHISGDEISNTTSDSQGMQVTNLKSGNDTAEFNIACSMPCILIGISYVSIPRVYSQIKERHYMHVDRYDKFQPMLQYFGDQEIFNREKSDLLPNPEDSYGYVSRNGEYKQRVSQVSGAFLCTSLRSWLMVDDPLFSPESPDLLMSTTQSPLAIREFPFEFSRFLKAHVGYSLATDFHFILQYNNKNVDNRPMDINPLPLYPNSSL